MIIVIHSQIQQQLIQMISKKPAKKKKETISKSKSKSKGKHRRNNTFISSDFSWVEDRMQKNFVSASVCDLFRHQPVKNPKMHNTSVSVYSSRPPKKKGQKGGISLGIRNGHPQLVKNKPNKPKIKSKKQLQPYQRIPLNSSHSGSDLIIFSNQDTKRQSQYFISKASQPIFANDLYAISRPKQVKTRVSSKKQNEPKPVTGPKSKHRQTKSRQSTVKDEQSQSALRQSIKREYNRKVQAVIKIQKVFRGYLTRKILRRYIATEEHNLQRQKKSLKHTLKIKTQVQQFIDDEEFSQETELNHMWNGEQFHLRNEKLRKILKHTNAFHNKDQKHQKSQNYSNNSNDVSHNTFRDVSKNQFEISQYSNQQRNRHSHVKQDNQNSDSNSDESIDLAPEKYQRLAKQYPSKNRTQQDFNKLRLLQHDHEQSSNSEQEDGQVVPLVTRHPMIYSRDDIPEFLDDNSDAEQYDQYGQEDIYEPNVIFETNQEYLESRKSSLQNKNSTKNQLAAGRSQDRQKEYSHQREFDHEPLKRGSMEVDKSSNKQRAKEQTSDKKYSFQFENVKEIQSNKMTKQTKIQKQASLHNEEQKQREQLPITCPSQMVKTEQSQNAYHMTFNLDDYQTLLTQTYSFPKADKQVTKTKQSQSHQRNKKHQRLKGNSRNQEYDEVIEYSRLKKSRSRQNSNSCSSSSQSKPMEESRVQKLRQSEKERWEQISQMISRQVHQNQVKSSELSTFMNSILNLCNRNKQLLKAEEVMDADHTTPTTTIDIYRTDHQQFHDSAGECPSMQRHQRRHSKTPKQEPKTSQFRKKKNLQIQIVEDVSNTEGLSLSKSKQGRENVFKKEHPIKELAKEWNQSKPVVNSPRNVVSPINLPFVPKPHASISQRRKSKEELIELIKHNNELITPKQSSLVGRNKQDSPQNSEALVKKESSIKNQTCRLKNFLSENIQNQNFEEMLTLRQSLLQKRESQMLVKLNKELSSGKLSQQEFIKRLSELTRRFEQQKISIDQARADIEKGYQAAMGLVKQTYKDAKSLGIKVNFSRSQGNMKVKNVQFLHNLVVDQFHCYTPNNKNQNKFSFHQKKSQQERGTATEQFMEEKQDKKQRNNELSEQFSQSSSIELTEQQLQKFRRIQPYDSEFTEMNKNITITDDFFKQQMKQPLQTSPQKVKLQKRLRLPVDLQTLESIKRGSEQQKLVKHSSYAYKEVYEVDQFPKKEPVQTDPRKHKISELMFEKIIYECAIQILEKPILNEKLVDRTYLSKPHPISKQEQQLFIGILEENIPENKIVLSKLNQKISPLPRELLKCMRIDFSEDYQMEESQIENEDNDYQQIGKYEFIIGQEVCAKALIEFRERIEKHSLQRTEKVLLVELSGGAQRMTEEAYEVDGREEISFQELNKELNFEQRVVRYMSQREKFISNRKKHTKGLRWEILNIQVHSIFDAWNEQLIQLRTRKAGYSGIGLNELTLSLIDQNKPIEQNQVKPILDEGKQRLLEILNDQSQFSEKMLKENFEEMCQMDSTWIYYADQALSYGLELHYLVEEEIFMECAREIIKTFHGLNLIFTGYQPELSEEDQYNGYVIRGIQQESSSSMEGYELKQDSDPNII